MHRNFKARPHCLLTASPMKCQRPSIIIQAAGTRVRKVIRRETSKPAKAQSNAKISVSTWRAGGGSKYIARLGHLYNLLTKCCNLPYKWC